MSIAIQFSPGPIRLADVVEELLLEVEISKGQANMYRRAVDRFSEVLGREATAADLTTANVNRFIIALGQSPYSLSATSVKNWKTALLRTWNYLIATEQVAPYSSKRLRKPIVVYGPPDPWSPAQVEALLNGCGDMTGRLRCGIPASRFMRAMILLAWDTGLRPIDCRLIRWEQVDWEAGTITLIQHKTRKPHVARLSDATKEALEAIREPQRAVIFALGKAGIYRLADLLYEAAQEHGFSRRKGQGLATLRKCHATAIARQHGLAAAAESLGHVPREARVAATHYVDPSAIAGGRLPPPVTVAISESEPKYEPKPPKLVEVAGPRWTTRTEQVVAMYVAGTTPAMIAQLMRMELGHVVNILSATKQIETAQRNADIAAAYRAGTKVVELARQYSLSHARVREILDEAGCVCRKRPSGEATKQRDAAMVEGFTSGATTDQLAKLHGITRCRVTQVLRAAGIRIKRGRPAKGGTDHVAE